MLNIETIKNVIPNVLSSLQNPEKQKRTLLINEWPKIAGPTFAPKTKPSLTKEGILYIWVEQSTLAFEINQKYKPSFLKRTQAVLGEEAVKEVRIRVGQLRPY